MRALRSLLQPVDTYIGLWSGASVIGIVVFSTAIVLCLEYVAHRIHGDVNDPRLDQTMLARIVDLRPFLADLPFWWIRYEGGAIREVVRSYNVSFIHFLFLIIAHTSLLASAIGFSVLIITMYLAVRAFSFDQTVPRRWIAPLICLVPWIAHIAELMNFLKVAVQYPKFVEPETTRWESIASWCSLVKWTSWAVIAVFWVFMAIKIRVAPPVHRALE